MVTHGFDHVKPCFTIFNNSIDKGVLPVPPKKIFPTQITGNGLLCCTTNIVSSFIKNRQISVAGKNKYFSNDNLAVGLCQNLGNNIFKLYYCLNSFLYYLKTIELVGMITDLLLSYFLPKDLELLVINVFYHH